MINADMTASKNNITIMWFRQDFRLRDNPAYAAACASGARVLPIYILDDEAAGAWERGAASRWWLHHALQDMRTAMDGNLHVFAGNTEEILLWLVEQTSATSLHYNACYEPWQKTLDATVHKAMEAQQVRTHVHHANLLFHPESIVNGSGDPYKVFTYFYKNGCLKHTAPPRHPLEQPATPAFATFSSDTTIDDLRLLPTIAWDGIMKSRWKVGEDAGKTQLQHFLMKELHDYHNGRNRPDRQGTSSLSPYLHFGHISPHQVWYAVKDYAVHHDISEGAEVFLSEIGWREFAYYMLYHFPTFPDANFQSKFNDFAWEHNPAHLKAWQQGKTGYPIVDAGMRQLWQEGWMHNRVRMIVGSFLIKDLLIDWREGEKWFWDTLLDADLASNSMGWQWVAGSGADAAPYFRIFNPVSQGEKFDPSGDYVRRYVPELKHLSKKYIHKPWEADTSTLEEAGIVLGKHYPKPIVDHAQARDEALKRFKAISGKY
jgi:deoxyribodipyrimidine photo-lyase